MGDHLEVLGLRRIGQRSESFHLQTRRSGNGQVGKLDQVRWPDAAT
jgi:hypothetical protein